MHAWTRVFIQSMRECCSFCLHSHQGSVNRRFVFSDLACLCVFLFTVACTCAPCCVRACSERQVSRSSLCQFIRLTVIWNRASEAEHTLHCLLSRSLLAKATNSATVCLTLQILFLFTAHHHLSLVCHAAVFPLNPCLYHLPRLCSSLLFPLFPQGSGVQRVSRTRRLGSEARVYTPPSSVLFLHHILTLILISPFSTLPPIPVFLHFWNMSASLSMFLPCIWIVPLIFCWVF